MVECYMLNGMNEREKYKFESMTSFTSWLQEYCSADVNEPILHEFYEMVLERYDAFKVATALKNQSIWLEFAQKKICDGKFNKNPLVIGFADKAILDKYEIY